MSQQSFENPQTPSVEPKTPIDRFFAAASIGLTQWWRWVLGIIVAVAIWQIATFVLILPAIAASSADAARRWNRAGGGIPLD